jgi:hypothetical protein
MEGEVIPRGRPTKLTQELQSQIVAAIQHGCYVETAAQMVGVAKQTFYDWLKKGARAADTKGKLTAAERRHLEFSDAVKRAMAQSEFRDIHVIDQAAQQGQWQAAAWKLERKHHARWGRKVAVTDEEGGNFFDGMARAWATALETEAHSQEELPRSTNGSGS